MTSDAEFGQSEYEMTVSPQEDGSYELTATGDPVAFGFKSIVSKTTNAAYKGGSSDTDLQDGTIDYIVRYLRDVNLKGELDKDDVWYGYNNDNTFDAPKEVGKSAGGTRLAGFGTTPPASPAMPASSPSRSRSSRRTSTACTPSR